jgi:glycosyltransferase involved in cell wall biosynthesis
MGPMTRPRVLFVCHGHPDLVPGGTELVTRDLCHAVGEAGYADTLFLGCVTRLHRRCGPESRLQTINASGTEMLLWVGGYDPFAMAQTDLDSFVNTMRAVLDRVRPDIVHFHHLSLIGLEALTVVKRLLPEARIVVTLHDYAHLCFNDGLLIQKESGSLCRGPKADGCHDCFPDIARSRFFIRFLHIKTMLGLVDRFIAPSRFLRDRFVAWGLPAERIRLIANAVPAHAAPRLDEPDRDSGCGRPDRRKFGYFGNIAPHKGVIVALAAVQQVADADVSLAIHGGLHFQGAPFRARFNDALAAAQGAACWHGPYARDDIARLMADVAWIIVPSTWWENAPLVILEAFRHRRPVICSNIGGMAEMVADGVNGLHFRAGDPADLARVIRRAATEPELLERLRRGVPEVPALTQAAAWHAELYDEVLGRGAAMACRNGAPGKDAVNPLPARLPAPSARHDAKTEE